MNGSRLEEVFLAAAARDPSAPAVVHGDIRWSYARLAERASAIAGAIGSRTDLAPARIGICYDRGPEAYAAVLAVLLAGATYVPIHPQHPPSRITAIVRAAKLDLVLADDAGCAALSGTTDIGQMPPLLVPHRSERDLATAASSGEQRSGEGQDLAYLLFTSGSTGTPKGVPISHANALSFVAENGAHYGFGPHDRFSQTFDLTFDLSVFDLFMAWRAGGCLYTAGPLELMAPVEFVNRNELTVWFSVPSVGALAGRRRGLEPGSMQSLRWSLFCGEALTTGVADAWGAAAPASVVENLYGPTELTIACSRYRWSNAPAVPFHQGTVPIGEPFPTMTAVVLDTEGHPVEPGSVGELCLTGPQRFAGYWNDHERTEAAHVEVDGRRFYRTGDRVFERDGLLHFVGRLDGQLQVLGHRVEVGEVEAAVRTIDDVVDAVAVGLPRTGPSCTHLGVAVTLVDGSPRTAKALRRAAAQRLPGYMAPKVVDVVAEFPLNANGKIDRAAVSTWFDEPSPS